MSAWTNLRVSTETTNLLVPLRLDSWLPTAFFPLHAFLVGQYPHMRNTGLMFVTQVCSTAPTMECRPWHGMVLKWCLFWVCSRAISSRQKHVITTMRPVHEVPYYLPFDTSRVSLLFNEGKRSCLWKVSVPLLGRKYLLNFSTVLNRIYKISTILIPILIRVQVKSGRNNSRPFVRSPRLNRRILGYSPIFYSVFFL